MTISKLMKCNAGRVFAGCSIVFMVLTSAWPCDVQQTTATDNVHIQQPPFQVRLLYVQRDWPDHPLIQHEVRRALDQRDGQPNHLRGTESNDANINLLVPQAGHAAVFEPQEFSSLSQWLRDRKLLLNLQTIPLQTTRFDGRWTGSIEPSWDQRSRSDQVWHLEVEVHESKDPAMVGRIKLKRTHARQSPPAGPKLRGAAIDLRKDVCFYLPKEGTVVLKWYAHPEDPQRDTQSVVPVLVFEAAEVQADTSVKVQFHLPKRVFKLMLD